MTGIRREASRMAGCLLMLALAACQTIVPVAGPSRRTLKGSHVTVEKNDQAEWNLFVDGAPYFIRGILYHVAKAGQSPDEGFEWVDWAYHDEDRDGQSDGPYNAWVDANRNNRRDEDEIAVGDFWLLQEMGVNTIRWYHHAYPGWLPNKHLLRDLYMTYGIRTAVGDLLGADGIGSGASLEEGTDYRHPLHRQQMIESVKQMVREHKDEPYLLLWLLGDQNNWTERRTNAARYPEVYAKFVNEVAALIHQMDGKHPVVLVNGDMGFLDEYARWSPEIDIFGVSAFRGPNGFGVLWDGVRRIYDRPVIITAYGGSDAGGHDEDAQAAYHRGCWLDIVKHRAGGTGAGNSLGGFASEWLDRWWAAGDPYRQAAIGTMGRQGGQEVSWEEEYTGICGQGDGRLSPLLRQARKVYGVYEELWGRVPPELRATRR